MPHEIWLFIYVLVSLGSHFSSLHLVQSGNIFDLPVETPFARALHNPRIFGRIPYNISPVPCRLPQSLAENQQVIRGLLTLLTSQGHRYHGLRQAMRTQVLERLSNFNDYSFNPNGKEKRIRISQKVKEEKK